MKKKILLLFIACLPLLAKAYDVGIGGIYYNVYPNANYAEVTSGEYCYAYESKIVIPSSIEYEGITYPVTKIGDYAFRNVLLSDLLTSVIIPNSVTEIGRSAFSSRKKLKNIIIPASVTKIGSFAFQGCNGLTKIEFPNSVVEIGIGIFHHCDNLTEVVIPNSIKEIESEMFGGCSSLTTIVIPDGITRIRTSAFYGCSSLTEITIPNSVTYIDSRAFAYCGALKTITLGSGLKSIDREAFANCPRLEDIYSYATEAPPSKYTDMFEGSNIEYATLHVPKSSMNSYKTTYPWNTFGNIVAIPQEYQLTYLVDGEVYQSYEIMQGTAVEPEAEPTKEGYTFSGWSEIPDVMPDDNVTVTGSFIPNKYTLTYVVDGVTYQTVEIECDAEIPTNSIPAKEGYTFVTNDDIPKTMPAYNITITGSFVVNKYVVTYIVDGETYKTVEVEYGASIPQENAPVKEGYTFVHWSGIPDVMPAHDVTVTAAFTVNQYVVTYIVDGETYKTVLVKYGESIPQEDRPIKEGYTFVGWNEIPETMPAHDVTVTGSFVVNQYVVTYIVDGEIYKTIEVEYGVAIPQENAPVKEGHTFGGWDEIPDVMPAYDITITGSFTVNTYTVTYLLDGAVYTTVDVEYGSEITLIDVPQKEGYIFMGWNNVPETMPAYDIIIYGNYEIDTTGISDAVINDAEYSIYTVGGNRVNTLKKGVNIIRTTDGQTKKVYVK